MNYATLETTLGRILLVAREEKLCGLYFMGESHAPVVLPEPGSALHSVKPVFQQVAHQIKAYCAGELSRFELPLEMQGTSFQLQVWQEINRIPFGETLSYTQLSERLGNPSAVRAVAAATGQNPLSWIVPCHRVVGKSGQMTGYTGGLHRKIALLEFERRNQRGEKAQLDLIQQVELALH